MAFFDRPTWTSLRPRALAVLAAGVLALPLAATLHSQAGERALLLSLRQSLDPLAATAEVHRALLQHEASTDAVLRGEDVQDPVRRVWQAEVDRETVELQQVLIQGRWSLAQAEAEAMRDDWQQLLDRIEQRRIGRPESRQAHRLLVEQSMMVGDLATLHIAQGQGAAGAAARTALLQARAEWLSLRPPADATLRDAARLAVALQARRDGLAQQLATLERQQWGVRAALVLLALATALLLVPLRPRPRAATAAAAAPALPETATASLSQELSSGPAPADPGPKAEARELLERLRQPVSPTPPTDPRVTRDR